jgi:hypothetical protein
MSAVPFRHPELASGSIPETALPMAKRMLKKVQHDGDADA